MVRRLLALVLAVVVVGCGAPPSPAVAPASRPVVAETRPDASVERCVAFERAPAPAPLPSDDDGLQPLGHRVPAVRHVEGFKCCYSSPSTVKTWLRPAVERASECYESALARRQDLRGRMTVRFELGWDGRTTRACDVTGDSDEAVHDAELAACVLDAFGAVAGPEASDCGVRAIVYPLRFEPSGA